MRLSRTRLAYNGFYSLTGAITLYAFDVKCQLRQRGDYVWEEEAAKQ